MCNSKTNHKIRESINIGKFPLSSKYDPEWIVQNSMGPNVLWLTEWLCQEMELKPGMRILDMGCGKAASSIFLVKEFGVDVWAADLWIKPSDNLKRICEAGLEDKIFPIHAEARSLPFAAEYFDAIVCVDSYIYYGTDDLYLNYFAKFAKPGTQIAIAIPGLMQNFDGPLPEHLKPFWGSDCWTWHNVDWWRALLERPGVVDMEIADTMENGCENWLKWKKYCASIGNNSQALKDDIEVLSTDSGKYIGLIRLITKTKKK